MIDEVFIPNFRDGNFFEGLNAGLDRVIKVIDGEPLHEVSLPNQGNRPSACDRILFRRVHRGHTWLWAASCEDCLAASRRAVVGGRHRIPGMADCPARF